jgi:hypothetical protein
MFHLTFIKMKSLLLSMITFALLLTGCDSLPASAKEFISAHFPDAAIRQVTKDRDDLTNTYDVILDNQVKLEFDRSGDCYDIEGKADTKLPDTVIPLKVLEYIQTNYPDHFIIEWEKDKTTQEIKLSNRTDLVFNLSGTFLRIDN